MPDMAPEGEVPEIPQSIVDAIADNPDAFIEAMQEAGETFKEAMENGGDMEAAMEAMETSLSSALEEMGCSQEDIQSAGDSFGQCAGPALQAGDTDASADDVGEVLNAALDQATGDLEIPQEVSGAFDNLANDMVDAGADLHEVGEEMMGDHPMPEGFVQGDPTTLGDAYGPGDGDVTGDTEGCEGDMGDCSGDVSDVSGDMTGCQGDMTGCSGDVSNVTGDVSDTTGDMSDCSGDVTGCSGDVTGCSGDVSSVYGDMSDCSGDMSGCSGNVGPVSGDMSDVSGHMGGCHGDMGDCSGDVSHVTGDMGPVNGDMGSNCGHVTGCEGDMTNVAGDVSTVVGDMSGCEGDATHCANDMSQVSGDCSASYGDMTGCSGDMTGCSGDMTGTYGDMSDCAGDYSNALGEAGDSTAEPVQDAPPTPEMDAFDTSSPEFGSPEATQARAEVNDAASQNEGSGEIEVDAAVANPAVDVPPITPTTTCGTESGCAAGSNPPTGDAASGMENYDSAGSDTDAPAYEGSAMDTAISAAADSTETEAPAPQGVEDAGYSDAPAYEDSGSTDEPDDADDPAVV
jgi:uncharacterized protein YjbJ (UPF0337 family)